MVSLERARAVLRPPDRAVWDDYVRIERDGVLREALPVLTQLVDRLVSYPVAERRAFVLALTEAELSPAADMLPIRHPLFDKIVLPLLLERYDRNDAGSARLLLNAVEYGSR